MREIKCRIWDKKKMKMYYLSHYTVLEWHYTMAQEPYFIFFDEDFKPEGNKNIEVLLYIGLWNRKEIYEGDIFGVKNKWFKPIVKYSEKKGGFVVSNLCPEQLLFNYLEKNPEYEIIGNIYENPELLKED